LELSIRRIIGSLNVGHDIGHSGGLDGSDRREGSPAPDVKGPDLELVVMAFKDSVCCSEAALGYDGLAHAYERGPNLTVGALVPP
jgi:hypothetical protein